MIHVLTIHWKSSDWIDIQLKYLEKNLNQPYRIYAFLNEVPNSEEHEKKFFYTSTESIRLHPIKLNLLADIAGFAADSDEDYLMFLDGDAFPIAPLDKFIEEKFQKYPVVAVQRTENNGDIQPHPCFCMMRIKTWQEIEGDWKHGGVTWKDKFNDEVWDVGGVMLKKLNDNNIDWYKLNRSNEHNLHPLLFGVYENLIYHHGAAFRNPGTRVDRNKVPDYEERLERFRTAKKFMPRWLARKLFLPLKYEMLNNRQNSEKVFQMIVDDHNFYTKLEELNE